MPDKSAGEENGWGFPLNSRKAHYFIAGRSLCGRWLYFGNRLGEAAGIGPDDCLTCWKKLDPEEWQRQRNLAVSPSEASR